MGSYTKNQKAIKYYKEHKIEYEENLVDIVRLFGIPCIYIKKSKYVTKYYLFNIFSVFSIVEYK